jgi:hypothetical protein
MSLAQSSIIEPIKKPFDLERMSQRRRQAAILELRRLHFELGYTVKRLAEITGLSVNEMSYIVYYKQHPETVRIHRSQGQHGRKKSRMTNLEYVNKIKVDLWCHLAVIAIRHNTAYRGLHPLEIVSSLKAQYPPPFTQAERDILDEVCAKYGYSFEDIPAGRKKHVD